MPKFLCTGDLHLGAGADLGREPGERLAEQEAVWLRIVQMANELGATILFAGDAWERRRPTPVELLAFRRPLHWLKYPALIIPGNHDVEAFERPTGYDVFLIVAGRAQLVSKPKVVSVGGAIVVCLPWAPASHLVALEGGGDRDELNRRLAEGLVEIARGLYSAIPGAGTEYMADAPIVLLTHWSVSGATASSGAPVDLFREPVLPLADLEAIGFDAIVAGHIHRPQMLGERGFYVGSPMPLNFGEAGHDHCVWLLDVEPGKTSVFRIPVESRPLVTLNLTSAKPTVDLDQVDGAVVKVKIKATEEEARGLDLPGYRQTLLDAGAHTVWAMQVDVDRPEIARGAVMDEGVDDVEAMARWLTLNGKAAGLATVGEQAVILDLHRDYLAKAAA